MRKWKSLERRVSHLLQGRRIPLSGGSWLKGDVITDEYLVEVKGRTEKADPSRFKIELKWLEKIIEEAKTYNRKPLLVYHPFGTREYWVISIVSVSPEPANDKKSIWINKIDVLRGKRIYNLGNIEFEVRKLAGKPKEKEGRSYSSLL